MVLLARDSPERFFLAFVMHDAVRGRYQEAPPAKYATEARRRGQCMQSDQLSFQKCWIAASVVAQGYLRAPAIWTALRMTAETCRLEHQRAELTEMSARLVASALEYASARRARI